MYIVSPNFPDDFPGNSPGDLVPEETPPGVGGYT